jgi:uncharacterized damage-inducible protein DinB
VTEFLDAFRHDAWATAELLGYCKDLSEAELERPGVPGTYGSIIETLRHITGGGYYRFLVSGEWPSWRTLEQEPPTFAVMEERARDHARFWEAFVTVGFDPDAMTKSSDGEVEYETPIGVIVAQALHHANHHRSEICVNITSMARTPPDVSAWKYALANGRSTHRKRSSPERE